MSDPTDGPLRGWYDIHQALRVELADLREHADRSTNRDPDAVQAFDERFDFLRAVLTAHSAAEDGIIFAAMRLRGLESTDELTKDHMRELGNIYDVHRHLVEARFLGDLEDAAGPLGRARDATHRLEDDLLAHLAVEEESVIPEVLANFSADDQASLLGKVVAENPPDLVPKILPWMIGAISPEHRVAAVRDWQATLPPEVVTMLVGFLRAGLAPDVWSDLEARVPELANA
jgi:hemerythrin superfamily protein